MKKVLLLLFIVTMLFSCETVVFAEENDVTDKLEDSINTQLDGLDFSEFDKILAELDSRYFGGGVKEFLEDIIISGGQVDIKELVVSLGNSLSQELFACLPICVSIILICILSSTISTFSSNFSKNSIKNVIHFICLATIVVLLISSVISAVESVKLTVDLLSGFINAIFPIVITMLTVIGGHGAVGVFSPYVGILSSVIIAGIQNVIFPIFLACLALSIVGNLTDSVKLNGIRKFLKSFSEWALGLGFGIFCTLISTQSIVTSSFDSISVKTAKFALSSYVPILGGYLSEGFDIVLAGSILIKNALGFTGILVIILITIMPLLKLIIFSLALKLTSGVVETFVDNRISSTLSSVASSIGILIAVLLGVAFVTFFVLLLVIFTVNAGVL